jgi:hypothetical protein
LKTTRLLPVLLALAAAPAVLAATLGATPEARGAPCAGSLDEARRHMERGFELYDKKQFLDGAVEFDAAYRAQPFSAFLCNAAMAYQEALDFPNAILRYKAFLAAEPNPPDLARIKTNLSWLEAQQAARLAAHPVEAGDAGADAAPAAAAAAVAAAAAPQAVEMSRSFRSQVIVVSDPPQAPLHVYARRAGAAAFVSGAKNPGWDKVIDASHTPHDLSLGPGDYHIVIDAFKDYRKSETDLQLLPGQLYEFKANLSQGEFLGFLRVLSTAPGALVFLDDPPPHKKPAWGRAPHGALVEGGEHKVWVEAPGYEPSTATVAVEHGKTVEVTPALTRVGYGYMKVDGNADEVAVKVDGQSRGLYTLAGDPLRIRLPSGPHKVELEAVGRKVWAGDVDVPRGQELGVHGRLSVKPARSGAVVTGALAVGAIIGGVALFKQAALPSASTTGTPGSPTGGAPTNAPTWLRVGGAVSFGLSALFGASTVYALVSDPTPPSNVKLDKPKELDDAELDTVPSGGVPGARGRVFGTDARAPLDARSCGAL